MNESPVTSAPSSTRDISPEPASATLKEIARRCGVGTTTAWRALAGTTDVSRSTTERVLAVAQEVGYSTASNRTARRMASIRLGKPFTNHAVALFLPAYFPRMNYYHEIHLGILDALADEGYDLLTARWDPEGGPTQKLPHSILAGEVDAAIVIYRPLAERLRALPVFGERPIVGILNEFEQCACAQADDEAAGFLAAGHLLDLGHRHMLHFYREGAIFFPNSERVKGYERACRERGFDPRAIIHGFYMGEDGLPHPEWLVRHLREGLKRFPETTALLAPNDQDAHVLYDALASAGRRLPEEFSLVGVDNVSAINDEHGRNVLTTVDLSLRALGEMAGRLLVELVTGKVSGYVRRTVPAQLVVRASTTAPRLEPIS